MKKILLCGMKYDSNFGDAIINDCCKYIVEEILKEVNKNKEYEIIEIDLSGKKDFGIYYEIEKNIKNLVTIYVGKLINKTKKFFKIIRCDRLYNYLDMKAWKFSKEYIIAQKYFKDKIKESSAIIFVGGGFLKYKYQNCYHYIDFVTQIAEKNNIPVCLNAVGVEGYNMNNIKSIKLKEALNRNCVKMITTRDDIEKLKCYVENNKKIILDKVADSAIYTSVVYQKEKNVESNYIGLGVCRGNLFLDNNINYTEEQLLKLWGKIIKKLNEENIKWEIYTNGLEEDNKFAYKLIKNYQLNKKQVKIPKTPKELVDIISNFKGIIATRLHSCIVAYSLNIPCIGLVWNQKLKMFGKSIGYQERFLESKDFNAELIVRDLQYALKQGYEYIQPKEYIKSNKEKLKDFVDRYL